MTPACRQADSSASRGARRAIDEGGSGLPHRGSIRIDFDFQLVETAADDRFGKAHAAASGASSGGLDGGRKGASVNFVSQE